MIYNWYTANSNSYFVMKFAVVVFVIQDQTLLMYDRHGEWTVV